MAKSGILTHYQDALGNRRQVPSETCRAVLKAMGPRHADHEDALLVVRRGQRKRLRRAAEITLEDGSTLKADSGLPPDLPLGYHRLRYLDAQTTTSLIVTPRSCYLPPHLRIWGLSVQL